MANPTNRMSAAEMATLGRLKEAPGAYSLLGIYVNLPPKYQRQLVHAAREINRSSGKDRRHDLFGGIAYYPVCEDLDGERYEIRPSGIRLRHQCAGGFGKYEVELRAGRLVMFFKEQGDRWVSFTLDDLARFYRKKEWDAESMLFGIMGGWLDGAAHGFFRASDEYLMCSPDGRYCITSGFIERCVS